MLSTSTILSLLGISAMQVVAGLSVGYWLRSRRMAVSKTSDALTRRLTDALGRIQTLADDFGAEAIDHVEQVKAVARTLNDAAGFGAQSYFTAGCDLGPGVDSGWRTPAGFAAGPNIYSTAGHIWIR